MDWLQWRPRINSLGRVRCEPGWDLRWTEPDRLTDYDLWFVWEGIGRMRLMDREVDLHAGRCFWMRPGRTYLADQDPTRRLGVTYIHFDLIGPDGLLPAHDFEGLPDESFLISEVGFFDAVTRRIVDRLRLLPGGGSGAGDLARAEAEALLYGLILGCVSGEVVQSDRESTGPGAVTSALLHEQALRILESPEQRWDVSHLAREVGCSVRHFARLFKRTTGRAPRDFIVDARVQRARHLLRNLDRSITEIAEVLGYADVFLFSRQFKARTGVSPMRFRTGDARR
ncbi:MAG: AraC family transcriptional regulator [Opitutaceae bacterium]